VFDADALFAGGGERLEVLHLDRNSLNQIGAPPATNFRGLTGLRTIDLSKNPLVGGIETDAFGSLSELQTLRLADSELVALPEGVFSGLLNLESLEMHNNAKLEAVPLGLFSELCSLEDLRLNGTDINAFADNAFSGWPRCDAIVGGGG
jgi:Leucine-rich repeat (LRR) protein